VLDCNSFLDEKNSINKYNFAVIWITEIMKQLSDCSILLGIILSFCHPVPAQAGTPRDGPELWFTMMKPVDQIRTDHPVSV
jgi:hypothetical protein